MATLNKLYNFIFVAILLVEHNKNIKLKNGFKSIVQFPSPTLILQKQIVTSNTLLSI